MGFLQGTPLPGVLLWVCSSQANPPAHDGVQQGPEALSTVMGKVGGWPDGGWRLAGLMSVFGLIYEACPRKDGFNSALEVWSEPYCRSISWAVKHFTALAWAGDSL